MTLVNVYIFEDENGRQAELAFPPLSDTQLELIVKKSNVKISLAKETALPTYIFYDLYTCIRISDVEKLVSARTAAAFKKYMYGQTVPLLPNYPENEQDFCYLHDWDRFIRGLPVLD